MSVLNMQYKDGGPVPEGVGLLISILVRYAEVGSIYYWQEEHALKFTFMIMGPVDADSFAHELPRALEVFHGLERRPMSLCQVKSRSSGNVHMLTIVRDVDSMTQSEVGLIVDLVKGQFREALVSDDTTLEEDELLFQEEMIGHMLANIRDNDIDKNVVAVREEGRVLVFKN